MLLVRLKTGIIPSAFQNAEDLVMQSHNFDTCFYICVKCDRLGILCGEKINWEHKMFRIPASSELNRMKET